MKMNECLCIKSNTNKSHLNRLPASACNYICKENSDDIYSGECGGKRAYNIYGSQGDILSMIRRGNEKKTTKYSCVLD